MTAIQFKQSFDVYIKETEFRFNLFVSLNTPLLDVRAFTFYHPSYDLVYSQILIEHHSCIQCHSTLSGFALKVDSAKVKSQLLFKKKTLSSSSTFIYGPIFDIISYKC